MTGRRRAAAALAIGLLIVALYGRTIGYGLAWDDYAALRPHSAAALLNAWTGSWDPGGVWPDFYRPLSIAMYDAMFRLFGHHGAALHAVNLGELFLAAWLLRAFVRRETGSDGLGLAAALLLVLHPETPTSLAAWISQQFHLVPLILALWAMLTWQRVRHRGPAAWSLVFVPLTLGVLMKEDMLMIAPTLLAWQMIRARIVGDVPPPARVVVWAMAAWVCVYGIWRTVALGVVGGYGTPTGLELLLNAVNGPARTFGFLWIPGAREISLASGAGVCVLAAMAWRRRHDAPKPLLALALCGLALGVFANLPLLLVTGHTRVHLLILAATLTLTAAAGMVLAGYHAAGRVVPRVALIGVLAWVVVTAAANWANTGTFAPCAPEARKRDEEVLTWDLISNTDRREIIARMAACQTGSDPFSTGFNR